MFNSLNKVDIKYMGSVFAHENSMIATDFYQSSNILAQKLSSVMGLNHVCSPLSIAIITSLLHLASVGNTETQITNLMTRKSRLDELVQCSKIFNTDVVKLANLILVNQDLPVKKEYTEMLRELALVSNEDFNNTSKIVNEANSFIELNTNNLIKEILKEDMISTDTLMILISTIYFKTKWAMPFKHHDTHNKKFNVSSDTTVDVMMMTNTKNYQYSEDSNMQLVELPYVGNEYCMGIILPKQGVNIADCTLYLDTVQTKLERVEVYIPKFTQRSNIDLIPYMKKMGITDLFCEQSRLDNMISMSGDDYAFVSTMIHEAVVIVDEEGTEASAVTVAVCMMECAMMKPKAIIFNANHPFIYYIKHKPSNTLLFVGDFHGNS